MDIEKHPHSLQLYIIYVNILTCEKLSNFFGNFDLCVFYNQRFCNVVAS